jgi:hypothetical protein
MRTLLSQNKKLLKFGAILAVILIATLIFIVVAQNQSVSKREAPSWLPPINPNLENPFCVMKVIEVAQYPSAINTTSIYVVTLNLSFNGTNFWQVNIANFQMISNSLGICNQTVALGEQNQLLNSTLYPGQNETGQIAFLMPTGQLPSNLKYVDGVFGLNLDLDNLVVTKFYSELTGVTLDPEGLGTVQVCHFMMTESLNFS